MWQEVSEHMDCSPQLREPAEHRKQTTKVTSDPYPDEALTDGLLQSGLEERLDKAVEEGRFECATQLSEQLAQREVMPLRSHLFTVNWLIVSLAGSESVNSN